ncbi:MAG: hypothetical protein M1818_002954 [Claussenomyces sp. TS43310]|nr:MAG: hypothetical protein M1818_002954 [Claussenomyces sp. TS43310]
MVDRPKKPTALATTPAPAPQPQVNISHSNDRVSAVLPTGESVEILLYGATITSWKTAGGEEKLWLSDAAKLDGTKAVRGGIPLVFPVFGKAPDHAATSKLPQHGFARISRWEFLGKSTTESSATKGNAASDGGVKLDFGLYPANLDEKSQKAWPYKFGLVYSVTLSRDALETSMEVRNEGTEAWEFQLLMHSYFRVKDVTQVSITGLADSQYVDQVDNVSSKTQSSPSLSITGETDRVYHPAGGPSTPLVIADGGRPALEIVRDNLDDAVVWNPWVEKAAAMADFEPKDGYRNMICVEAGHVAAWVKVEPGETFEGGQIVRSLL